jgi:hypothetical protein
MTTTAGGIKPLASLDAAMLGRRGAVRRVPLSFAPVDSFAPVEAETIGAAIPAEVPEVIRQVERLALALGLETATTEPASTTPAQPMRRIAFTLRIDTARHARLRRIVGTEGRSAQQVLIDALDLYCARSRAATTANTAPAIIASHRTSPTGNQP